MSEKLIGARPDGRQQQQQQQQEKKTLSSLEPDGTDLKKTSFQMRDVGINESIEVDVQDG